MHEKHLTSKFRGLSAESNCPGCIFLSVCAVILLFTPEDGVFFYFEVSHEIR